MAYRTPSWGAAVLRPYDFDREAARPISVITDKNREMSWRFPESLLVATPMRHSASGMRSSADDPHVDFAVGYSQMV